MSKKYDITDIVGTNKFTYQLYKDMSVPVEGTADVGVEITTEIDKLIMSGDFSGISTKAGYAYMSYSAASFSSPTGLTGFEMTLEGQDWRTPGFYVWYAETPETPLFILPFNTGNYKLARNSDDSQVLLYLNDVVVASTSYLGTKYTVTGFTQEGADFSTSNRLYGLPQA